VLGQTYSLRNDSTGSIRVARSAGIRADMTATMNSAAAIAANKGASYWSSSRENARSHPAVYLVHRSPRATPLSAEHIPLAKNRAQDVARRCTKRNSNAELALSFRNRIRHDPVDPERGEADGQCREGSEHGRDEIVAGALAPNLLVHSAGQEYTQRLHLREVALERDRHALVIRFRPHNHKSDQSSRARDDDAVARTRQIIDGT
jgi:hypothetical protein